MATVAVYNMQGAEVGKMDLNDAIFGVEVNEHLVKMVVTAHLAAERQGTQKAKTRSEVPSIIFCFTASGLLAFLGSPAI